jgi:hypothetical protein
MQASKAVKHPPFTQLVTLLMQTLQLYAHKTYVSGCAAMFDVDNTIVPAQSHQPLI